MFEKCPIGLKDNFDKQRDVSTERNHEFNLPLVNAKHGNNGVMYYGRESEWDSVSMSIDIVNDGAISTGDVYPQPQKTGVLYNAYLIKAKSTQVTNSKHLMFLSTVISKAIKHLFGYEKKASWDRVKNNAISLPILTSGDIDFDFMENCIAELEAERVVELEAEKFEQLEAYLTVTGLNDYELTDKENLAIKNFNTENWCAFPIQDFVTPLPGKRILSKKDVAFDGTVDVYSSDSLNNGIIGQTNLEAEFYITKFNPFYIVFGDHTRSMNIATKNFCVTSNVRVLSPKFSTINEALFICSAWKKTIPILGYARHWSVAKNSIVELPSTEEGLPDFEAMQTLISAVKKLVIKDFVEYSNNKIKATKQAIAQ